jgi:hypothetical protein
VITDLGVFTIDKKAAGDPDRACARHDAGRNPQQD